MRGLTLLRRAQYGFWFAGILLCGLSAGVYLQARYFQAMENRRLEDALRSQVRGAIPQAPAHVKRTTGSLVGRLEIPRLKFSAIVLEGSDSRTLRLGVGRIPGTAEPGQEGNLVLGGHRDTFFRPLRGIRAGDFITLATAAGPYRYVVEWTAVVDPRDTGSLHATSERSLTLVTCYPFYYVGPAPQRFIVRARQLMPGASATSGD
jgi:LPXTG-site transpeptidase (sortase) family protein